MFTKIQILSDIWRFCSWRHLKETLDISLQFANGSHKICQAHMWRRVALNSTSWSLFTTLKSFSTWTRRKPLGFVLHSFQVFLHHKCTNRLLGETTSTFGQEGNDIHKMTKPRSCPICSEEKQEISKSPNPFWRQERSQWLTVFLYN